MKTLEEYGLTTSSVVEFPPSTEEKPAEARLKTQESTHSDD